MELTWLAIAASLMMGLGGACLFIFAVKRDYLSDIEETKYQVFWSDMEELVESTREDRDATGGETPEHSRR